MKPGAAVASRVSPHPAGTWGCPAMTKVPRDQTRDKAFAQELLIKPLPESSCVPPCVVNGDKERGTVTEDDDGHVLGFDWCVYHSSGLVSTGEFAASQ